MLNAEMNSLNFWRQKMTEGMLMNDRLDLEPNKYSKTPAITAGSTEPTVNDVILWI